MSCIDEIIDGSRVIIGIRDYKACATPESRLYINDLPGMSLKNAAAITPDQWASGTEFLRQSTIMAARHVFDEFASELQPYFNFKNIVESRDLKVFSTRTNAASATERGIVVKRWRSEAARLYVEHVYVKVSQDGTVTIKIIDGQNETETEFDVVAGTNILRLDYKAEEESIRIVFDQTAFETYDLSYTKGGGCSTCGSGSNRNIYVSGWDGSQETSNTYGMGVKVHVQCYEENILCSLLPKMYFLMWYKSGIMILNEHMASSRINHVTVFGKEQAEKLLERYEAEYKEKYKILVKSAYEFLRTTKGECITCNNIRYVQSLP